MMLIRGDIDGIIGYHISEIDLYSGTLMAAEVGLMINASLPVRLVSSQTSPECFRLQEE